MSDNAVGIKDLLVNASVGTFAATSGWGIYIGMQPPKPDTCITIRLTGGRSSNPRYLLDFPSIQVRVRGTQNGYVDAFTKCKQVKDVLLGLPSQDLNGDRWVAINAIGDINALGEDENNRPTFSMNFALIIEPAASAETNRESL